MDLTIKIDPATLTSLDSMVDAFDALGWDDVAARAYDAYGASVEYKNFRGDPMPAWDALPAAIQTAWICASQSVASEAVGIVARSVKVD